MIRRARRTRKQACAAKRRPCACICRNMCQSQRICLGICQRSDVLAYVSTAPHCAWHAGRVHSICYDTCIGARPRAFYMYWSTRDVCGCVRLCIGAHEMYADVCVYRRCTRIGCSTTCRGIRATSDEPGRPRACFGPGPSRDRSCRTSRLTHMPRVIDGR